MSQNREDTTTRKNQQNPLLPRNALEAVLCLLLLAITVNYSLYA